MGSEAGFTQTKSEERFMPATVPQGHAYADTEGKPQAKIRFLTFTCDNCDTEQEVRADSFLPGAHILICDNCHHTSSRVRLLDGSVHEVSNEARTGGGS